MVAVGLAMQTRKGRAILRLTQAAAVIILQPILLLPLRQRHQPRQLLPPLPRLLGQRGRGFCTPFGAACLSHWSLVRTISTSAPIQQPRMLETQVTWNHSLPTLVTPRLSWQACSRLSSWRGGGESGNTGARLELAKLLQTRLPVKTATPRAKKTPQMVASKLARKLKQGPVPVREEWLGGFRPLR